jgi:4-hydroxy-tetrahydrodipicolinate reductase
MEAEMRAVLFGCDPIGCRVARLATERGIMIVGAMDGDPARAGRDLGEMTGLGALAGIGIGDDGRAVLAAAGPDLVFHAAGSRLEEEADGLRAIIEAGCNVVSTCEELSYPWWGKPDLARELDGLAKHAGVTLLGTGINPGFLMDAWPLFMSGICGEVRKVDALRIQDAAQRRLAFQRRTGAGHTPEEFDRLVAEGEVGHVGLVESTAMIAAGLGWTLETIDEQIEPVMAMNEARSEHIAVEPGLTAGVRQVANGLIGAQTVITLEFQAFIGARESLDAVVITGTPDLQVKILGGVNGDIGAAAALVNAARRVVEAPAGLMTMKDLPCPACFTG